MRHHLVLAGALLATVALAACDDLKPAAPAAPAMAPEAEAPKGPATMPALILPVGFSVTAPQAGATTTSPLVVTGVAPNDWYFEAVFEAVLLDAQGNVLTEAPAQAQSKWTTPGPVPFKAELSYAVSTTQTGTIVLTEDQTGEPDQGDATPVREVRIPVVLTAAN